MTLIAIKESLDIWVDRLQGKERENNCPLCKIYRKGLKDYTCFGCPIFEKTGQHCCKGTTYYAENQGKRNLGMVKLLVSLLPDYEPELKVGRELNKINFDKFLPQFTTWNYKDTRYSENDLNRAFNNGKKVGERYSENDLCKVVDKAFRDGVTSEAKKNYQELLNARIGGIKEGKRLGRIEAEKVKQDELDARFIKGVRSGRKEISYKIQVILDSRGI